MVLAVQVGIEVFQGEQSTQVRGATACRKTAGKT
jgi:hypothetical protein